MGPGLQCTSPFWVADNNGHVSTLYNGRGQAFPVGSPLVATIPKPPADPTGIVFNGTGGFVVTANSKPGSSLFLFATEDGTILGWSPVVNPTSGVIAVDNSGSDAVYKGLAIGRTSKGNFLYATNFSAGVVEMYDKDFHRVSTFTDSSVDANFAPFGIENIGGKLFVTFALQKPSKHDDQSGLGNGFVDVFETDGTFVRRFASHGALNSPGGWRWRRTVLANLVTTCWWAISTTDGSTRSTWTTVISTPSSSTPRGIRSPLTACRP